MACSVRRGAARTPGRISFSSNAVSPSSTRQARRGVARTPLLFSGEAKREIDKASDHAPRACRASQRPRRRSNAMPKSTSSAMTPNGLVWWRAMSQPPEFEAPLFAPALESGRPASGPPPEALAPVPLPPAVCPCPALPVDPPLLVPPTPIPLSCPGTLLSDPASSDASAPASGEVPHVPGDPASELTPLTRKTVFPIRTYHAPHNDTLRPNVVETSTGADPAEASCRRFELKNITCPDAFRVSIWLLLPNGVT